ncbi:MAG TPA: T9SS type A sorting domain-containing protein, partial [Phaeodactylibacter sp.]|nr:T9SS type A sorting domain-containing protein [Phaeodactylibacter sp.]
FDAGRGELRVYPNPSNGQFTLEAPAGTQPLRVEVYDLQGRLWLQKPMNSPSRQLQGLLPGMYLLRLYARGGVDEKKVLVE